MGIFPWYSKGDPILWWSPVPRLILKPAEFHLSKRLARDLRKSLFRFSFDQDFRGVVEACAASRTSQDEPTWINNKMLEAYSQLHDLGFAHSVECWQDNKLAGGLYGVAIGAAFFGESMFSRASNSSKACLAILARQLEIWDFDFIDCQMRTNHLISLGAKEISGPVFFNRLQEAILKPEHPLPWQLDNGIGDMNNAFT